VPAAKSSKKAAKKRTVSKKAAAKKVAKKKLVGKKSTAKKKVAKERVVKKAAAKKTTAKKVFAKKKAAKATTAKKIASKKTTAKKAAVKKVSKKTPAKKKTVARKAAAKPAARVTPLVGTEFQDFTPYKARSGEDYMNTEQVEHFRNILASWRQQLMEEVERTVHHMQDDASNFPDPNDRATQEEEFALELRARDRERKLIKKINEALNRLDSGDYGFCEMCGVEIGVRRLEARPTATLCIDCKTLDEIRERQLG
jgi:DnaK suppressor protein